MSQGMGYRNRIGYAVDLARAVLSHCEDYENEKAYHKIDLAIKQLEVVKRWIERRLEVGQQD